MWVTPFPIQHWCAAVWKCGCCPATASPSIAREKTRTKLTGLTSYSINDIVRGGNYDVSFRVFSVVGCIVMAR